MSESKEEEEGKKPSKRRFKSICVFGESEAGNDVKFLRAASELGDALAARKIHMVYGGGFQGLRGCAAISASLRGSKVLGVLLKDDIKYTVGTELRVSSLPDRIGCMFYNADAFIALPGGLETLNGISNISYWVKLNAHQKPLGLLNVNGFYDGLISFLDHAVEERFIPQASRRAILSASTADQLIDQLQGYATMPNPFVKQIDGQSADSSKKRKPDTSLRL